MTRLRFSIVLLALALLCSGGPAYPQAIARPDQGKGKNVPYDSAGVETVNLQNGNLMVSIPLASLPPVSGGKLGFTVYANYNSKLWNTYLEERVRHDPGVPIEVYNASVPYLSPTGGWRIGGGYSIETDDAKHADYVRNVEFAYTIQSPLDHSLLTSYNWFKTYLVTPDGSRHEILPLNYQPFWGNDDFYRGYFKDTPETTGQPIRYYSAEGSFIWVTIYPESYGDLQWEAHLRDGTVVKKFSNYQRIEDTNGNRIKIFTDASEEVYQDERTGREIRVGANAVTGKNGVSYRTVGGSWHTIEIVMGSTEVAGKFINVHYPDLPGNPGCVYQERFVSNPDPLSIDVVREIIFPQTESSQAPSKYSFEYSSDETHTSGASYIESCGAQAHTFANPSVGFGELSKMTVPGGAIHRYKYQLDDNHVVGGAGPVSEVSVASNTLTEKSVHHDGETNIWSYSVLEDQSTVTNPDGSTHHLKKHVSYPGQSSSNGGLAGLGGLVYSETTSGKIRTDRHFTRLVFDSAYEFTSGMNKTTFNAVVSREFTSILENGQPVLMSAKRFEYDFNGNIIQTVEYDWFDPALSNPNHFGFPTEIPSGATILRTTSNSFHDSPLVNSSNDVYAKSTKPLLNAVKETSVGSSITRYSYDDQLFNSSPVKGNVTKVEAWNNVSSQWIGTLTGYDAYGNVTSRTDANGNVTQIFYEDNTFAMPTKVVVDPNNGTGPHVSTAIYDFHTGLQLSGTDPNGATSTVDYHNHLLGAPDPFGRVGTVYAPSVNGQQHSSKIFYEDAERKTRTESDLFQAGDGLVKQRVSSDQLGRAILTERNENGSNDYTVFSETAYFIEDRVVLSSNPRRATSAGTDGWTRVTSDILGRRVEVASFAGSELPPIAGITANWIGSTSTLYEENATTVEDPAGKARRSISNALGQLIRVDEPDSNGNLGSVSSPNQPTHYYYNTLGKMVRVNQGVQNRYFMYDSLGRLLRVRQPEQEVNSDLTTSGNPDNNSWTVGFSYDNNGNLLTTRDANNVVITSTYDALNRPLTRTYSDTTTPSVAFSYDEVPGSKGQLTKVASTLSEMRYTEFDEAGRLKTSEQRTDGEIYPSEYKYNLSGALIEQKYPSGRVVKNVLDSNGDISIIQSKRNANFGYWNYAEHFTYNAAGVITKMQLGNGLWETAEFNSRLQSTQLGLGTLPSGASLWKVDYEFGELQTNGTVDTVKNSGNIARQTLTVPGTSFVQSYTYDSLHRLKEAVEKTGATTNWSQQFGYDRYGNRTSFAQDIGGISNNTTPAVDASSNRFTSTDFGYDANGNIVVDIDELTSQARDFVFDGDNKQTEVKQNGITIGRYYYDGEGRRIKKVTDTETTIFVYSADKLVAEYSTAVSQTPSVSYTTADHLGSPRVISNELGMVASRRDFMPFGEELYAGIGGRTGDTGLKYSSSQDDVRQKFTTYERDNEINLDFAEARYYNPMHGRFTAVDPLLASAMPGNPQSWNRYIYVGNNPLVITDPTGLSWYYSSADDRYKWFNDGDTVDDGYTRVVGTRGNDDQGRGSFVYESENGWVRLNPYTNSFSTFDTRAAATGDFESVYQCNCQGLVNTIADESVRKGTTVAITAGTAVVVGTGAGVAMAATGTAVGGTVTTLGLTGTGTAATTAATTTAVTFTSHGAVHAATEGFSQVAAESAIRAAVQNIAARAATTGEFWGKVTVGGSTIVYRAYTLADGTIRIGTYYDPTKK